MSSVEELLERGKEGSGGYRSNGSLSDLYLKELESYLKVKLPKNYKEFLSRFGSGKFGYVDFYGGAQTIPITQKAAPNVSFYNKMYRDEYDINQNLLAIADAGSGDDYCINLEDSNRFGHIYIWNPSLGNADIDSLEEVAESLEDFLNRILLEEY